jgi:hypothetical protein
MADGLDPKAMAVVLLLVSIFFHYFSYSFTIQAYDYGSYDISLSRDELYSSGIMLGDFDEHNVTYEAGTWTSFEVENKTIRTQWQDWNFLSVENAFDSDSGDGFAFQSLDTFFGFPTYSSFFIQNINKGRLIRNETILARFDTRYNSSRFLSKTGYALFFTDPQKQGNISRALSLDGELTLTIVKNMNWADAAALNTFVSWYIGLVTGSETWGLPPSFSIIVRVMTMLGIFSGIFLMVEARRLIKIL